MKNHKLSRKDLAMATVRINRRIVNSKRHTTGFVITGNREIARSKAVSMARRGQISGVRVISGPSGPYLMSTGKRSLYSLPTRMASKTRSKSRSQSR